MIRNQVKIPDISRILDHVSVVVVLKAVNAVDIDPGYPAVMEQTLLVKHPVAVEQFNRIIRGHTAFHDGYLLCHILGHLILHLNEKVIVQHKAAPGLHKKSLSK